MRNKITCNQQKNNRGSTLIIVLVVLAFVSILGTITISSAMLNLKMKMVDKESQKSFYTSEEAVDQVYAGIGIVCMNDLKETYTELLSSLTRQTTVAGNVYSGTVDNDSYNIELRQIYMEKLLSSFFSIQSWSGTSQTITETSGNGTTFVDLLNEYIEDEDSSQLEVLSVGEKKVVVESSTVHTGLSNYYIECKDVTVQYLSSDGYYSVVTIDCTLGLPDVLIDFVDTPSGLTTYEDYSLIGCSGILLANNKELNLDNTKAYAGGSSANGGLEIGYHSRLNAYASTIACTSSITVGKDLDTGNGSTTATASSSELNQSEDSVFWCADIEITSDVSDSNANLSGSTFVQDDLTVNGDSNTATISGNYIGWSYEDETAEIAGHNNSSAIILNGTNSTLDLSSVTSLILGGCSYLGMNENADTYITGESVSLKADQEVYLIPDSFLKKKSSTSSEDYYMNPVAESSVSDVDVTIPTTFFGYDWLDSTQPYTAITVEAADGTSTLTYYYFNIQDENRDDYINAIINYDASNGTDVYLASLKNLLVSNLTTLQQQSLVSSDSSDIYLNGALIKASIVDGTTTEVGGEDATDSSFLGTPSVVYDSDDTLSTDGDFEITATDMRIRYGLLTSCLYEYAFYNNEQTLSGNTSTTSLTRNVFTRIQSSILYKGTSIDISGMTSDVFANFINEVWLNQEILTTAFEASSNDSSSNFQVYITKKGLNQNLIIDDTTDAGAVNISSGLIVTTGNVIVRQDFDGLIIAKGTITVDESVTIQNSYDDIEDMLDELDDSDKTAVRKFFNSWNETSEYDESADMNNGIYDIGYEDIVIFDNWRN